MNAFKLTLTAIALTIGSSAAYADASRAPALNAPIERSQSVETVAMRHVVETRSQNDVSATKSRPTIFGHDVAQSSYAFPYDHAASAGN